MLTLEKKKAMDTLQLKGKDFAHAVRRKNKSKIKPRPSRQCLTKDNEYDENNYDLEAALVQGAKEVAAHQRGELDLPDAREFLNSLD